VRPGNRVRFKYAALRHVASSASQGYDHGMHMRIRALGALLIVGICLSSVCCTPNHPLPFTVEHQVAAAADVQHYCVHVGSDGMPINAEGHVGTGVAVAPNLVLTAGHLVTCHVHGIHIDMPDSGEAFGSLLWFDRQRDLAMVVVPEGALGTGYSTPAIASPMVGEMVCARVAEPNRGSVCGVVIAVGGKPDGDVTFTGAIEHGNSGAGVYDSTGHLVGIVTELLDTGGGRFVSLHASDLH
jgi:S1-C subfamily serine protease